MPSRLIFTVLVVSFCSLFTGNLVAQSSKGIRSEKVMSVLVQGGLGYTFYKMDNERTLVDNLKETGNLASVANPFGGISSQVGFGLIFHEPMVRVYTDIRWDNYGNEGVKFPLFIFDWLLNSIDNTGYYLNHSITTVNLHADKLFWHDAEDKDLYYGFGGSYGWIFDTRTEKVTFRKGGSDQEFKEDLDISANVAGIQGVIGKFYQNGVTYSEFRVGYQFDTGFEVESSKKAGRSAKSFKPDYNGLKLSIHIGLAL